MKPAFEIGRQRADHYDAVVIGGAVAGAGTALLLRRRCPEARILIVEREETFPRKVGEATVEVSAFFLHEALGLEEELDDQQLLKHGLRFWFSDGRKGNGEVHSLARMTEVGARALARVPTWQLDRSTLDETVLSAAAGAGCEVLRPAAVSSWQEGWPRSVLTITTEDGAERRVSARWVVDASGRRAFIARRKRLLSRTEEHPTAALWQRWRGVSDPDDDAHRLPAIEPRRRRATNHFCGYGWWCWMIPLAGGDTSIGLVYDKRHFQPRDGASPEERYRNFVTSSPGLGELLAGATPVDGDFHAYSHLPYRASRYAGRGWALVGDAAAFLDPYYSPGLDHVAMSSYATARLLADDLSGALEDGDDGAADDETLAAALDEHNARFLRSYGRWLEGLYLDKYEILGDAELTACAYLVDTSLYYLGVVTPIYRDTDSLGNPVFGLDNHQSIYAWKLMRLFNRRLNRIARFRRRTGSYGRHNVGRRNLSPPPGLGRSALPMLLRGLRTWAGLELHTLLARLRHGRQELDRPVEHGGRTAPVTGS